MYVLLVIMITHNILIKHVWRGASLYPTHHQLPPTSLTLPEPQVGHWLIFTITSSQTGVREGVVAILFNWNCKRDHVLFYALPRKGAAHLVCTPVLAIAAVTHHIEFTSLESLYTFKSALLLCSHPVSQKSSSLITDLSIQKCAVLMYSNKKLLFYYLFIKSLI